MEAAAASAGQAFDEKNQQKEARRQEKELRAKRGPRVKIAVLSAFAVAVLLANAYIYLTARSLPVQQFDPNQDPYLTAVLLESALLDYADAHEGVFAQALNDLLDGDYLPLDKFTETVLERFVYTRSSPRSYELRIKDPSDDGAFPETVFSYEGVDP